jgi:hypothetical protein
MVGGAKAPPFFYFPQCRIIENPTWFLALLKPFP